MEYGDLEERVVSGVHLLSLEVLVMEITVTLASKDISAIRTHLRLVGRSFDDEAVKAEAQALISAEWQRLDADVEGRVSDIEKQLEGLDAGRRDRRWSVLDMHESVLAQKAAEEQAERDRKAAEASAEIQRRSDLEKKDILEREIGFATDAERVGNLRRELDALKAKLGIEQ